VAIKIQPLGDRVLVKPFYKDEKTAGGVILPDKLKQKQLEAEVVEVGEGRLSDNGAPIPLKVQKGDIIICAKFSGTEVEIGDEKLTILNASDILARVIKN
jgi:chaperonin GroES